MSKHPCYTLKQVLDPVSVDENIDSDSDIADSSSNSSSHQVSKTGWPEEMKMMGGFQRQL